MKKILYLLVILILSGFSVLLAQNRYYTIQLQSYESSQKSDSLEKSLKSRGLPVYTSAARINEKLYFRVRLGFFTEYDHAKEFAEFYQFQDYWIAEEQGPLPLAGQLVEKTAVIKKEPDNYRIYAGKQHRFVLFYYYGILPETVERFPSRMEIYTGRSRVDVINVTGFKETETGIYYGKSHFLGYVDPPVSEEYAKRKNMPIELLEQHIIFFAGSEGRITLLEEYNFLLNRIVKEPEIGFDYVDADNYPQLREGILPTFKEAPVGTVLGNALLTKIETSSTKIEVIEGKNTKVYIRKDDASANSGHTICILFF